MHSATLSPTLMTCRPVLYVLYYILWVALIRRSWATWLVHSRTWLSPPSELVHAHILGESNAGWLISKTLVWLAQSTHPWRGRIEPTHGALVGHHIFFLKSKIAFYPRSVRNFVEKYYNITKVVKFSLSEFETDYMIPRAKIMHE